MKFLGIQENIIKTNNGVVNLLKLTNNNFASSYQDSDKIDIWDLGKQQPIRNLYHNGGKDIWTLELIKPDILASGAATKDFTIKLFNWQNGQLVKDLIAHRNAIYFITKLNENQILTGGHDKKIIFWNWQYQNPFYNGIENAHSDRMTSCLAIQNGKKFITCGNDFFVKLWDSQKLICLSFVKTECELKHIIQINPEQIAISAKDGFIRFFKIFDNQIVFHQMFQAHNSIIYKILMIDDTTIISTSKQDQKINFWNINNLLCINQLSMNGEAGRGLIQLDDGKIIVGSQNKNEIIIFK